MTKATIFCDECEELQDASCKRLQCKLDNTSHSGHIVRDKLCFDGKYYKPVEIKQRNMGEKTGAIEESYEYWN